MARPQQRLGVLVQPLLVVDRVDDVGKARVGLVDVALHREHDLVDGGRMHAEGERHVVEAARPGHAVEVDEEGKGRGRAASVGAMEGRLLGTITGGGVEVESIHQFGHLVPVE